MVSLVKNIDENSESNNHNLIMQQSDMDVKWMDLGRFLKNRHISNILNLYSLTLDNIASEINYLLLWKVVININSYDSTKYIKD